MTLQSLALPGLFRITSFQHPDARGVFTRIFRSSELKAATGQDIRWAESYVSTSIPGVVRGMHFQLPPHDHWKLVTCLAGRVLDVALDLRSGPHYGQVVAVELDAAQATQLLIPPGCAHGFAVLGNEPATLLYHTSSEHAPTHDAGIRWDSFGFSWPTTSPILSDRDRQLPAFAEFASPW